MRTLVILLFVGAVAAVFSLSIVLGNPALLPKQPDYPMGRSVHPVNGQPTANDSGQPNAGSERALEESAAFDDPHSRQSVSNGDDRKLLEKQGAGMLPKMQGPDIKIESPISEVTRTVVSLP